MDLHFEKKNHKQAENSVLLADKTLYWSIWKHIT